MKNKVNLDFWINFERLEKEGYHRQHYGDCMNTNSHRFPKGSTVYIDHDKFETIEEAQRDWQGNPRLFNGKPVVDYFKKNRVFDTTVRFIDLAINRNYGHVNVFSDDLNLLMNLHPDSFAYACKEGLIKYGGLITGRFYFVKKQKAYLKLEEV